MDDVTALRDGLLATLYGRGGFWVERDDVRKSLDALIAAVEARVAPAPNSSQTLTPDVEAWRRLAAAHCGSGCSDEEHGRLLHLYVLATLTHERLAKALGVAAIEVGTPFPVFNDPDRCARAILAALATDEAVSRARRWRCS